MGTSYARIWVKSIPGRKGRKCRTLRWYGVCHAGKMTRRPVWADLRTGVTERKRRGQMAAVSQDTQDPFDQGIEFGFYSKRDGKSS